MLLLSVFVLLGKKNKKEVKTNKLKHFYIIHNGTVKPNAYRNRQTKIIYLD